MRLVVDIRHWLDEHADIPHDNPTLRRRVLRIARLIEYGGPLARGEFRETLVECSCRPMRKPCLGLLWVSKEEDDRIYGYCLICTQEEIVISGWRDTMWADGPMEPATNEPIAALAN